eukprot:gene1816-33235_t
MSAMESDLATNLEAAIMDEAKVARLAKLRAMVADLEAHVATKKQSNTNCQDTLIGHPFWTLFPSPALLQDTLPQS